MNKKNKIIILLTVLVFAISGCSLFKDGNETLYEKNTVDEVETSEETKDTSEESLIETESESKEETETESEEETQDEKTPETQKEEIVYEKIPNDEIDTFNGIPINFENSYKVIFRDDKLTIVNKKFRLDPKYRPENIVNIDEKYTVYGYAQLEGEAYEAFLKMRKASEAEGLDLRISTGYRDYDFQKQLYTGYLAKDSQEEVDKLSARPGHSEHQLGTAADFSGGKNNLESFTGTPEQLWMAKNAHKFGFILRYPEGKENITGYSAESWHYRYVGDIAEKIYNSGQVLEEYLGME
ncbi:M15 family metallopeptidase [Helcococcus kunzii]|uniref:M15 family metallopeptidase n=1 Tax=Helcococcus kunzii TaxID=40091 RepID=UPI0024AE1390|nr:M15 family metallopeptidase [Helcococcus kunzii]